MQQSNGGRLHIGVSVQQERLQVRRHDVEHVFLCWCTRVQDAQHIQLGVLPRNLGGSQKRQRLFQDKCNIRQSCGTMQEVMSGSSSGGIA